jgi:tagatose 6-phosphate kinase
VIVTVTLNPALQVGYEAGGVSLGQVNKVRRVRYRPGGRGLAVARVLHTFGHDVVAAGLVGGSSGEIIRAELARAGVATQFTWIGGESRRVLEVTGEVALEVAGEVTGAVTGEVAGAITGAVTTFREPAPYITTEELGRLAADYRALMADATAAVLCGSLPDGLPAETYGSLASYAAEAGVPVVLDAGGSALWHGALRRPALVIPENGDAGALLESGAGAVAILSGTEVKAFTPGGEWSAALIGSRPAALARDALVAGFVPGTALDWSWPDTLAHTVALAASCDPSGDVDLEAYERLLPQVTVSQHAT